MSAGAAVIVPLQAEEALINGPCLVGAAGVVSVGTEHDILSRQQGLPGEIHGLQNLPAAPIDGDGADTVHDAGDHKRQQPGRSPCQRPGPAEALGKGVAVVLVKAGLAVIKRVEHPQMGLNGEKGHGVDGAIEVLVVDDIHCRGIWERPPPHTIVRQWENRAMHRRAKRTQGLYTCILGILFRASPLFGPEAGILLGDAEHPTQLDLIAEEGQQDVH